MIRPTRRAVLLFAGVLPLPWLALSLRTRLWPYAFHPAIVFCACLAADTVLARPRRRVQVKVDAPAAAHVGEAFEAAVTVAASGPSGVYEAALDLGGDTDSVAEGNPFAIRGRESVWIRPLRRGTLRIETAWLRWRGPLRLVEDTRRFPVAREVAVVPNVHPARGDALALYFRDALYGTKTQRDAGEGAEFESLREYAPGLDSRFIDWKHSARHRRMLVREFRSERNHPIVLAFDTGHLMREPMDGIPRLDHSINAGLLLARVALAADDLVGIYSFDSRARQFMPPGRGVQAFRRLQQASAGLAYTADETNFTLGMAELQSRLRRRSLVVLFTDFIDTITAELLVENVRRLSARHLLVFVTLRDDLLTEMFEAYPAGDSEVARAVLAADFLRERNIVLEKLERLGVQCIDTPATELSTALLNRYLMIKHRGLL
ncbi:MAG TPA: DUF58 domain-containing protein [Candidatus Acidoferrales bacterium]|nr:DUF58 domain-containing protein [Candidatus Acidoferrales bacterium]